MLCNSCGKPETDNPGVGSDLMPLSDCCPSLQHHLVFHRTREERSLVWQNNAMIRWLRGRKEDD